MKKTIVIVLLAILVLGILLGFFSYRPLVFCNLELPEGYMEAIRNQAKGLYSQRLPIVPVLVKVDSLQEETVCYRICYFPFGTVGMSYHPTDGYNIEKPLSRM